MCCSQPPGLIPYATSMTMWLLAMHYSIKNSLMNSFCTMAELLAVTAYEKASSAALDLP